MVNVVPLPTTLVTSIRPQCSPTMRCAMLKPKPEPASSGRWSRLLSDLARVPNIQMAMLSKTARSLARRVWPAFCVWEHEMERAEAMIELVARQTVEMRHQHIAALKAVDEEEACTLRLYAAGKISEETWNGLWAEWQDRRNALHQTISTMSLERGEHIDNLETALQIIAQIGKLYLPA